MSTSDFFTLSYVLALSSDLYSLTAHFKPSFLCFLFISELHHLVVLLFTMAVIQMITRSMVDHTFLVKRTLHRLQIIHAQSQVQQLIFQSRLNHSEKSKPLSSQNSKNQKEKSHNRHNHPLRFHEGMENYFETTSTNQQSCTRQGMSVFLLICHQLNV